MAEHHEAGPSQKEHSAADVGGGIVKAVKDALVLTVDGLFATPMASLPTKDGTKIIEDVVVRGTLLGSTPTKGDGGHAAPKN